MNKALIPNHEEIRRVLRAAGKIAALDAFDEALLQGRKIDAIRIARAAGVLPEA